MSETMLWGIVGEASVLHRTALVWDQHGCLPLRPSPEAVDTLERYHAAGVDVVSINVGFDLTSHKEVLNLVTAFRQGIEERGHRFALVRETGDIENARGSGKLSVFFDLEGTEPLEGDVSRLEALRDLGVRSILIAYNRGNLAGGGCHDNEDEGLTAFGRDLIHEMNRLGIVVDASHCSSRTSFDLFETSSTPVIFSHSCPAALQPHPRNISDDQIRGCAATGGVVGINGVSVFLGDPEATTESFVRAIDYTVELVGAEHVGIGLDYVFDDAELRQYVEDNPSVFPSSGGYSSGDFKIAAPEQLPHVTARLLELGYPQESIRAILGGNFARLAASVWH